MNDRLLMPTFFCPKPWEGMAGDETTRFCTYCNKHVHNLAAMSVQERLALLSSPAGSICARYRIAIRRPAPGKEEPYTRHLLKYGAGVAAAGAVLFTMWEMHERDGRGKFYRVFGDYYNPAHPMPDDHYVEEKTVTVGMVVADPDLEIPEDLYVESTGITVGSLPLPPTTISCPVKPNSSETKPAFIDIKLDPAQALQVVPDKPTFKGLLPPQKS